MAETSHNDAGSKPTGVVIAMAIIYDNPMVNQPDPVEIANDLLNIYRRIGVVKDVSLHPHCGIVLYKEEYYNKIQPTYDPTGQLDQMLKEGCELIRDRLKAIGKSINTKNGSFKTLKTQTRGTWAGDCLVALILQG